VALRAYALEGHRPALILQQLDQVVEGLDEELATAVYLEYDPAVDVVRYASAGHPPALLIAPDGAVTRLDEGLSPPLGCLMGGTTSDTALEVEPGSTVIVYTDGLVERRGEDLEVGLRRLEAAVVAADHRDLDAFCDAVLADMGADDRGDDIALLVARLGDAES
jgi:serine phosphatase RsbU (regulator of sigma subunit)